jgi:hypothetical protein
MEPCTAPTISSRTAKSECGCSQATETQPSRVFVEHRTSYAPVGISPLVVREDFPSGLVVVLAGAAALAWFGQKRGARLVQLHLARPARERRLFRFPRLVLSDRERRGLSVLRAFLGHARTPALIPARAAMPGRMAGR